MTRPDSDQQTLPDTLTQRIGVLTRREVEARILAPIIEALGEKFGRDDVIEVVRETIVTIACEQGRALRLQMVGDGSEEFLSSLQFWTRDDALEIELLEHSDTILSFNVTRCRYAELYRALGIPELGAVLSCNRDYALIAGFNDRAELVRSQTIMEGASHCDFRYTFAAPDSAEGGIPLDMVGD